MLITVKFSPVGPQTRFCDFTAEDKAITAYVLADLDTPALMARARTLVAEKENLQPGATQSESNAFMPRTSTADALLYCFRLFEAPPSLYVPPFAVADPTAIQQRDV